MRVGIEALWRASGSKGRGQGGGGDDRDGDGGGEEGGAPEGPKRVLSGWDRDMPAVRGSIGLSRALFPAIITTKPSRIWMVYIPAHQCIPFSQLSRICMVYIPAHQCFPFNKLSRT